MVGTAPGTWKHSAIAKGKASTTFEVTQVVGGGATHNITVAERECVLVCADGLSHSQASASQLHHSRAGPRGPQIFSFPVADAWQAASAAHPLCLGSDPALNSVCSPVNLGMNIRSLNMGWASGGVRAGGTAGFWLPVEVQPLHREVSHTGGERNLLFLLHLERKLYILN